LASIQRELDMAVILITHDLGVVARVATHVAVMYAGEIVETGTAREVFSRPTHPYTQGLFALHPSPRQNQAPRPSRLDPGPGAEPGWRHPRLRLPQPLSPCVRGLRQSARRAHRDFNRRAYRCLLPVEQCAANALVPAS
jgi:peptide/nickel transport system ATP-binding protein